jgi:hypothetical protein
MVADINIFNRFFYFLIDYPSPEDIMNFSATEDERARMIELIEKNRDVGLSLEEELEVEYFKKAEHLVRMAKIKAAGKLGRLPQK